ncbi:MAG: hypothetical protein K2X37_07495 [Chitinophagaceae bacterium]|nr:hypothetical protein [Chitinophagaceae bacterium]
MKKNPFFPISFILVLQMIAFVHFAQSQPVYEFKKKISLPTGDAKWDYLKMDEAKNRLFISHGDRVHVIDVKTNTQLTEFDSLKGVHGIALATDFKKGYITNGTDNSITIFDYNSLEVLKTIKTEGKKADAILYDAYSKQVYVFNNGSGNAIVINPKNDSVIAKIEMGGAPEFGASDNKGSVFNNNEDSNTIFEIDTKSNTIKNKYAILPNKVPTGLAYDAKNNRLFSVCRDPKTLVVLDANNGNMVQTLPIGAGVDAVAYDKKLKLVFTSNGEGTVSIFKQESADIYSLLQTLKTQPGLKTMALNPSTHEIYLSGADFKEDKKTPVSGSFGVYVYGIK